MPGGLKRYQKAETLHFITFSCFRRLPTGWHTLHDADLPQMRVPHPSLFSGEGWAATNFSSRLV